MRQTALLLVILALAFLAAPRAAEAQPARGHRIGFISSASSSAMAARDEAFRQGLRALGYVVGQNITIEYRWADGKNERLPAFAAELVNLKLDIIVTHGVVATRVVKQATTTIPSLLQPTTPCGGPRTQPRTAGREHHGADPHHPGPD